MQKDYFLKIKKNLAAEMKSHTVYPSENDIYSFTKYPIEQGMFCTILFSYPNLFSLSFLFTSQFELSFSGWLIRLLFKILCTESYFLSSQDPYHNPGQAQ